MFNSKYFFAATALCLATSVFAGGVEYGPVEPAPAPAPLNGFYVNTHGGLSLLSDSNPYNANGYDLGAALGYRWDNLRFEIEGAYNLHNVSNRFRSRTFFDVNGGGFNGFSQINSLFVFFNVYYNFDYGSPWIPYVGAGIGYQKIWSQLYVNGNTTPDFNRRWSLDNTTATGQGILGIDYRFTDNIYLGINYTGILFTPPNYVRVVNVGLVPRRVFITNDTLDSEINASLSFYF